MLTKALDFSDSDGAKSVKKEEGMSTISFEQHLECRLKHNPEELLSLLYQPPQLQQLKSHREKRTPTHRTPPTTSYSYRPMPAIIHQPGSTYNSSNFSHHQLQTRQRSPANYHAFAIQHRHLKPGFQRSQSSSTKIAYKPVIDCSSLTRDSKHSFSSGLTRPSWDESLNALSQSLKDICGSPKSLVSFNRSNTVPVDTQVNKDKRSYKSPLLNTPSTSSVPQHQNKFKRGSDPIVSTRHRPYFDVNPFGPRLLTANSGDETRLVPTVAISTATTSWVTDSSTNPTIDETLLIEQLAEDLEHLEVCDDKADYSGSKTASGDILMNASCLGNFQEPETVQEFRFEIEEQPVIQLHKHHTGYPSTSPRCSFSLPGSNVGSPAGTLVKRQCNSAVNPPKCCMRRINSVFLEPINRPLLVMDPSLKKITVRHEESSRSLELELTRLLFSHTTPNSPIFSHKSKQPQNTSSEQTGISPMTGSDRSEFMYKVPLKPHNVAPEDLFVQLVGERTLHVGVLRFARTGYQSSNSLAIAGQQLTTEAETISTKIIDKITLPNELYGWVCSLSEDRRWLTIREVFRSASVKPTQQTNISLSPSPLQSFVEHSPKSSRFQADKCQAICVLEYSANCSARYSPILVSRDNSSQMAIVMKIPEEFDQEDLLVKRFDQKVIIKGRKKQQSTADIPTFVTFTSQPVTDPKLLESRLGSNPQSENFICSSFSSSSSSSSSTITPKSNITQVKDQSESTEATATSDAGQNKQQPLPPFTPIGGSLSCEIVAYFSVTIPLPPEALGRTLGAYLTPHKNVVIYAAMNQTRRRLSF